MLINGKHMGSAGGLRKAAGIAACLGVVVGLWATPAADAAAGPSTITVAPGLAESSVTGCSLRAAIQYANASSGSPVSSNACVAAGSYPAGPVTIVVPASATHYTLTGGALSAAGSEQITIAGAGAGSTVIDGGGTARVFSIGSSANVRITGLTVTGGLSGTDGSSPSNGLPGGGIDDAGILTLDHVLVSNNATSAGATGCTGCPGGNGGSGGGVYSEAGSALVVTNS